MRGLNVNPSRTLAIGDGGVYVADPDERYGAALAVGDFDGDGVDDLAIGAPGEKMGGVAAGRVHIRFGGSGASIFAGMSSFSQNSVAALTNAVGDDFGAGLAAGDANGDGVDDLVVGVPGKEDGAPVVTDVGVLVYVPGGTSGLDTSASNVLRALTYQSGSRIGDVVALVDDDGDSYADVWAGVPTWDVGPATEAGAIIRWPSTAAGPASLLPELFVQDDVGGSRVSEDDDRFGYALAAGDFTCDGDSWLVVGSHGENAETGRLSYLRYDGATLEHENHGFNLGDFTPGVTQYAYNLGFDLAVGDFDDDGCDDVVSSNGLNAVSIWMGAPGASWPSPRADVVPMTAFTRGSDSALVTVDTIDVGAAEESNIVLIAHSARPTLQTFVSIARPDKPIDPSGLSVPDVSFSIRKPSGASAAARLADERRYMASTTKQVLSLVIMESAYEGRIALGDTFTITADHLSPDPASCVHGGVIGLTEGDTIGWWDLLHFISVRSAGDAAYAAGVELGVVNGAPADPDFAVAEMNAFAAANDMEDTWFVTTTGRDAPTWWADDYGGPKPAPDCSGNPNDDTELMVWGDDCYHFSTARDMTTAAWLVSQDFWLEQFAGEMSFTPTSWSADTTSAEWLCASGGNAGPAPYNKTYLPSPAVLPNGVALTFVGAKSGTRQKCHQTFAVEPDANPGLAHRSHGAILGSDDPISGQSCSDERRSDAGSGGVWSGIQ